MVSNDLGRQLHDRATRGETLSADEQTQLEEWYARQDQAEAKELGLGGMEKRVAEARPSLWETLRGYQRFNAWELGEQEHKLAQLSVEESLTQFFELCDLARALAPHAAKIFFEQHKVYLIARRKRLQRLAKGTPRAKATRRTARSKRVSRPA